MRHAGGFAASTAEQLDALPGIGSYTARAICAFAFNKPEVFIETNIRSVFIHSFFSDAGLVPDADILPLVAQTLDAEQPRRWYYALMDYGAALKRQGENPSRHSAAYAKQSAFHGSLREARGAILRRLSQASRAAAGGTIGVSLEEIAADEGLDMARLTKAAEKLMQEGLIQKDGNRCRFA